MKLEQAIEGLLDAESKLSSREALNNPAFISESMYRLGQYASAVEKHLGDLEQELEAKWAVYYQGALNDNLSATAAKLQADVDNAHLKGQIKRLTRYVSSSWRIYTGAMARVNHLTQEKIGMKHET